MKKIIIILGLNNIVVTLLNTIKHKSICFKIITTKQQLDSVNIALSDYILLVTDKSLEEELVKLSINPDDLVISIGCPWILKKTHLQLLSNRVLNLHGTHLPMYRGGTIYSWYILNKRKTGLCALHYLTETIDGGGVVKWSEYLMPASCRKPIDFMQLYEDKNVTFLSNIIDKWKYDNEHPADIGSANQPEYLSSYWPRLLAAEHSWINWEWQGEQIETFICAFDDPYDGANSRWRKHHIKIKEVVFQPGSVSTHPFQSGLVFRKNEEWLTIAVSGGELIVSTILNEQNENIINQIEVGERLYSMPDDLVNQFTRIIKTNSGLQPKKYW